MTNEERLCVSRRLSPARAIVYGGLVVGTLDILDAVIFFGLWRGVAPIRIFQSIASGLLGRAAFQVCPRPFSAGSSTFSSPW